VSIKFEKIAGLNKVCSRLATEALFGVLRFEAQQQSVHTKVSLKGYENDPANADTSLEPNQSGSRRSIPCLLDRVLAERKKAV
jgi:hypothetical protein